MNKSDKKEDLSSKLEEKTNKKIKDLVRVSTVFLSCPKSKGFNFLAENREGLTQFHTVTVCPEMCQIQG